MTPSRAADFSENHITQFKRFISCNIKDLELGDAASIGYFFFFVIPESCCGRYTYKCMGSGFAALRHGDFVTGIQKIILQAGDADTNAAVAGAMLGCRVGYSGLPKEWVEGLVHFHWLKRKADELLRLLGLS